MYASHLTSRLAVAMRADSTTNTSFTPTNSRARQRNKLSPEPCLLNAKLPRSAVHFRSNHQVERQDPPCQHQQLAHPKPKPPNQQQRPKTLTRLPPFSRIINPQEPPLPAKGHRLPRVLQTQAPTRLPPHQMIQAAPRPLRPQTTRVKQTTFSLKSHTLNPSTKTSSHRNRSSRRNC